MAKYKSIRGRGASYNPVNRFEDEHVEYEVDELTDETPVPKVQLIADDSNQIISWNKSPDLPFNASLNPYRGCEHGCIYCYARPYHEYLGFSAGLDFETKIVVKYNAAVLLKKTFKSPKWQPQIVLMSGATDCYQPLEKKLEITRSCLKVFAEFRNPVSIITKNHLVTRDLDILKELAATKSVQVTLSVTSLDNELTGIMEPRTSRAVARLKAIETLASAGIPVRVNVAPVIPGLTDHEMPAILQAAKDAGASSAGYVLLRLPFAVKEMFSEWLEQHFPDRKSKIEHRLLDLGKGTVYNTDWGTRMKGSGVFADQLKEVFKIQTARLGLRRNFSELNVNEFKKTTDKQLKLFI